MENHLIGLLVECVERFGEKIAFRYRKENAVTDISFLEFFTDVQLGQIYFEKLSWNRVAIWGYNSYEWIVAATALLLAGKTIILLDGNLSIDQLLQLSRYTDVECMIAGEEMMDEKEVVEPCFSMISLMDAIAEARDISLKPEERLSHENWEGEFICFTSGTSRSSKGVVISAETLCGCAKNYEEVLGEWQDQYYLPLPYHHIYAFVYLYRILCKGRTCCIGQMGRYLIQDMELMKPQALICVPSLLVYLLNKNYFPSQMSLIFTGGSYLRPELGQAVLEKGVELRNLYGASETLGAICSTGQEKGLEWLKPASGVQFMVRDDGELGAFLPYHMKEYYKKPEDTLQVLEKDKHIYWTGDNCQIDADGYVKILGRMRDMIVLENGEKIHAEDTDGDLSRLPGVKEGAVICADGNLVAVIVTESGNQEELVIRAVKEYNRQHPAAIRIHELWFRNKEFPRTTTGKLKRTILEREYRNGQGRSI